MSKLLDNVEAFKQISEIIDNTYNSDKLNLLYSIASYMDRDVPQEGCHTIDCSEVSVWELENDYIERSELEQDYIERGELEQDYIERGDYDEIASEINSAFDTDIKRLSNELDVDIIRKIILYSFKTKNIVRYPEEYQILLEEFYDLLFESEEELTKLTTQDTFEYKRTKATNEIYNKFKNYILEKDKSSCLCRQSDKLSLNL